MLPKNHLHKSMKNPLHIFILLITCLGCFNPVLGQSKFSVGIVAAPTFNYVNTELTHNLPGENGSLIPVDFHSKSSGYGYSVGVLAKYGFSSRLSVATGLLLNNVNYREPTVTTSPDLNALPLPYDFQLYTPTSTTRSLQVPLLINYRTSSKRLSPYLSAGALTTLYSTTIFEGNQGSDNTIEKIQFHPTLAAGIDYRINERFSLIVQPTFVYYLPYKKVIVYKNYQLGSQGQVVYHF